MNLKSLCFIVISTLLLAFGNLFANEIKASAEASQEAAVKGDIIEVAVVVDMSLVDEELGSYTATLSWNEAALQFAGFVGGTAPGFGNPVVNEQKTQIGLITFAHANPYGADGAVNLLTVKFKVIGENLSSDLKLNFSAMAASRTFNNLLPLVKVGNDDPSLNDGAVPSTFVVEQNYPNPFNPETLIRYSIPQNTKVKVSVYNALGQQVKTLFSGFQKAGSYELKWDATDAGGSRVGSGIYYYTVKAGSQQDIKQMILLK